MMVEDQRILANVIDVLHRADHQQDAAHAAIVRHHLRAVIEVVKALELADDQARRRCLELARREQAAARNNNATTGGAP